MRAIPESFVNTPALEQVFVEAFNTSLGKLNLAQVDSVEHILSAFRKYGDNDPAKLVYILATAWHESKLKPIKEYKAKEGTRIWELQKRYWPSGYYGRGFVQLTWERNYKKMSDFIGEDLVTNPDLALEPKYAAEILVYGMMHGSFTRRALSAYINEHKKDYRGARKVVNGLDRAERIQQYAEKLEQALPFKF